MAEEVRATLNSDWEMAKDKVFLHNKGAME